MLKDRTELARCGRHFSKITQRDKFGRARVVLVPGTEAKRYQVILRRPNPKYALLTTECRLEAGNNGHIHCQGNNRSVCRHSMIAVMEALEGYDVSFCSTLEDAKRLINLVNGSLLVVSSHPTTQYKLYAVYR